MYKIRNSIQINLKKPNHISNSIYKIRGRESLNDFIYMVIYKFSIQYIMIMYSPFSLLFFKVMH